MVRTFVGVFLTVAAGCGSVSSEQKDAAVILDEATPDMPIVDAPPPRCDPTKPFGTPQPVANINSASDELGARLSRDELTIYFGSARGGGSGGFDIYMSTRASADASFSSPTHLAALSTSGNDLSPSPTPDHLGLVFTRNQMGVSASHELYLATRTSTSVGFTTVSPLAAANSTADETDPNLAENGNVLYFTSARSGGYGIYRATRQGDGTYAQVAEVVEANSANNDSWPTASDDGKALFIGSDRAAGNLLVLTRPSAGGSFGVATKVTELDTADDEGPEWLSVDTCVLYFHRNGTGGLGGYDIWFAKKPL